jgi:polyisoprenyl-phosphate glycosyltransferase
MSQSQPGVTIVSEDAKKLISIVVPVMNEEENIDRFYETIVSKVFTKLADQYNFELLFTDNHSEDNSFELIQNLAKKDPRVRGLRFSKNFGYQLSIYTGLVNSNGDATIQLDCDLQDPPELIEEFLKYWEKDYQVVYGIRKKRKENWFLTRFKNIFYRLINLLSDEHLPLFAGDFRLVDRKIISELKKNQDSSPYLRGIIATIGFNQIGIEYERQERNKGKSKFGIKELFKLAIDGILSHSVVPLRLASYTAIFVSLLTLFGIGAYFIGSIYFGQTWPKGFTTITILILISITLNAVFLGIIGEYLGRIYKHIKKPTWVIIEKEI